jgi:SAM-dependent methyltransferase
MFFPDAMQGAGRLTGKALARLRGEGWRGVLDGVRKFARARYEDWVEASLDRKYGIDTCGILEDIAALGGSGRHLADTMPYEPIDIPKFRRTMRIAVDDPAAFDFVDYGCGKGRALVLAAECGFRRVIGVEFAAALHAAAERNIEIFRRRRRRCPPIEVVHGDAADLPIPGGDVLLYFYNPFGPAVFRKVAANVERAWRARPARRIVVLYFNPWHGHVWDGYPFLRRLASNKSYVLYTSP